MKNAKSNRLGELLKKSRIQKGLSQSEVADLLGLKSKQSISDWERGYGSVVPIPALKSLIKIYKIRAEQVYDLMFELQMERLEYKIHQEFWGRAKKSKSS